MTTPIELPSHPPEDGGGREPGRGEIIFIGTATTFIRFGGFTVLTDTNFLHQGDHAPLGVTVTMDADQGVRALQLIRPRTAIPIHYDDYTVFKSPLADFRAAVERAKLDTEVHDLERGETFSFEAP